MGRHPVARTIELPSGEVLYHPVAIAERLHVSRQTVAGWIRDGRLPARYIGASAYVTGSDLEAAALAGQLGQQREAQPAKPPRAKRTPEPSGTPVSETKPAVPVVSRRLSSEPAPPPAAETKPKRTRKPPKPKPPKPEPAADLPAPGGHVLGRRDKGRRLPPVPVPAGWEELVSGGIKDPATRAHALEHLRLEIVERMTPAAAAAAYAERTGRGSRWIESGERKRSNAVRLLESAGT